MADNCSTVQISASQIFMSANNEKYSLQLYSRDYSVKSILWTYIRQIWTHKVFFTIIFSSLLCEKYSLNKCCPIIFKESIINNNILQIIVSKGFSKQIFSVFGRLLSWRGSRVKRNIHKNIDYIILKWRLGLWDIL